MAFRDDRPSDSRRGLESEAVTDVLFDSPELLSATQRLATAGLQFQQQLPFQSGAISVNDPEQVIGVTGFDRIDGSPADQGRGPLFTGRFRDDQSENDPM